jgi:hypothetical protein
MDVIPKYRLKGLSWGEGFGVAVVFKLSIPIAILLNIIYSFKLRSMSNRNKVMWTVLVFIVSVLALMVVFSMMDEIPSRWETRWTR